MRNVVVGAAGGLVMGALAGLPWLVHEPETRGVGRGPVESVEGWSDVPSTRTDLDRAVRILARHAGQGWVRCAVGDRFPLGGRSAIREWSHAAVENGELVAVVDEPEGAAMLHDRNDPTKSPPRVIVQWIDAWPGEAGRCRVLEPEIIDVPGIVVDAQRALLPGGEVHGELGPWSVDSDGHFLARCYRGAPCTLAAAPSGVLRPGRPHRLVAEDASPVELVYRPSRHPGWLTVAQHAVDAEGRVVHMVDPIDLALQDPLMPPPMAEQFLRWQERDEAARQSALGLFDALAASN